MNRQRLIQLREQLQNLPGEFDYGTFGKRDDRDMTDQQFISATQEHPCGTSACVAGWCVIINMPEKVLKGKISMFDADEESQIYLHLTDEESNFLFFPGDRVYGDDYLADYPQPSESMSDYSLQDALDRIDFLLNRPESN